MIYLFHKIDKNKALEYFEKAIKYAAPESKYYTSYALLYKALIKRDLGQLEEAGKCTDEAIKLSPKYAEAIFQNAQYNALQGKQGPALSSLQQAIELDLTYCLKADSGQEFNGIRDQVKSLFQNFQQNENDKAYKRWEELNKQLSFIYQLSSEVDNIVDSNEFSSKFERLNLSNELSKIKMLIDRKSILDARNANLQLTDIGEDISKFVNDTKRRCNEIIVAEESKSKSYQYDIEQNENRKKALSNSFFKAIPAGIFFGSIGAFIIGGIVGLITTSSVGFIIGACVLIGYYKMVFEAEFEHETIGNKFRDIPGNINELIEKLEKHKSNAKKLKALNFDRIRTI